MVISIDVLIFILFVCLLVRLAHELLDKESINLPQIIKILGDRPFEMKQSVRDYLQELETREHKEQAEQAQTEAKEAETAETAKEQEGQEDGKESKDADGKGENDESVKG